ncbi:hypothetical protein CQW23_07752 [Capsicum baccatum]|uniref:Uncharacterized protein n=1 Tax=Capsicum baccatum TaxID=33114 RepID=A0A2G2X747_CAPBA|nr:hypothetical protein CQW23_07752 [Capsicum baccatum]
MHSYRVATLSATWKFGEMCHYYGATLKIDNCHLTYLRDALKAQVGLKGKSLSLHTLSGSSSVEWVQGSLVAHKQPLTRYKATFNSPGGFNEKKCQTNCGQPSQIWYAIVRDMTAAGLFLNKFCYAALIAAHKNKEPVRDDIAPKMERTRTRDVEDAEKTLAIRALVRGWGVGRG